MGEGRSKDGLEWEKGEVKMDQNGRKGEVKMEQNGSKGEREK